MLCHAVIEAGWYCVMLLLRQGGTVSCCYRDKVVLCYAVIEAECCNMLLLRQGGTVPCCY